MRCESTGFADSLYFFRSVPQVYLTLVELDQRPMVGTRWRLQLKLLQLLHLSPGKPGLLAHICMHKPLQVHPQPCGLF